MKKNILCLVACLFFTANYAAEFQWSIPIDVKDKDAKAFLWIPPNCKQVKGIVLGQQVILEDAVFQNKHIRAACTKENLAIVLLFRGPLGYYNFNSTVKDPNGGADIALQNILNQLADISGYNELKFAPWLTVGHSGGAIRAWNMAYAHPNRVFGILTLHAAAMVNPPEYAPKARAEGIPVMAVTGEYESWGNANESLDKHTRWLRGDLLDLKGKYNNMLVCEVVQPGAGHFNFDDHLAKLTALFIQKAAHYKIPPTISDTATSVHLIPLTDADGWLTDIHLLTGSEFKPTPFKQFKGDPALAFWHLDEEMANAVENFPQSYGGKKEQRVCFVQNNAPVAAGWINELAYQPEADGITLKMKGGFLSKTPVGVAGANIPLEQSGGKVQFSLIGGWGGGGLQLNDSTFQIHFDHLGISRHTANLQVMAYKEGDANFKYAEQAGQIKFPLVNKEGTTQSITFPDLPTITSGTTSIALTATSSVHLPVQYFVQSGPATIVNNQLVFSTIPPRASYPIKVTIVAWQWGIPNKIQSAEPVERGGYITK